MRINQTTVFLSTLVSDVVSGSLMPAAFQRPYVWGREEVLALTRSILKGYPIGSFLTWTPGASADLTKLGRTRLGPLDCSKTGHSLLLDGQNRLATLAWLAHNYASPAPASLTDHEAKVWDNGERFVVDLAARTFEFRPAAAVDVGLTLPGYCLFASAECNREMLRRWDTLWTSFAEAERNEGLRWFETCSRAFSNARVVVTEMERATPAEAKDAFLHICRVGIPMSEADFDAALGWE